MNHISIEISTTDFLDLFAGEPTNEDLNHEEVINVKSWNFFRCKKCRKVKDMLKCKSRDGFIVCSCGHLN
jgi:hypothetical protein